MLGDAPGELRAWSLGDRVEHVGRTLIGTLDGYDALALSPSGEWLAVATGEGTVELWPVAVWDE